MGKACFPSHTGGLLDGKWSFGFCECACISSDEADADAELDSDENYGVEC